MKQLMPIGIIILVGGLGFLVGLGSLAILAGLTAMFCLMAAFGGSLAADLRLLAWFGPVLVLAVGVPRLLGEFSQWAAVALLVVIVFLVCLVPVLGPRYVTVGMGLGMAAVFSYGLKSIGVGSVVQIFGAPALAFVVVLALRVVSGARDPSAPLRTAFADALTAGTGTAQENATRLWFADRPRRWTSGVMNGIFRYRNAAEVLSSRRRLLTGPVGDDIEQLLDAASAEAARLAEAIRPKEPPEPLDPVRRRESRIRLPGATRQLVTSMWQGLELVQASTADRDASRLDMPPGMGRDWLWTAVRGAFDWHSVQLRHAIRCALGMLVALVVASFLPGNPFVVAFLLATFAIMQPQWQDTLTKAWQRVAGALAGAAALALALWLLELPQAVLVAVGIVSLLVGFYYMQSKPVLGNACTVFMSVAVNSSTRHLDPRTALLEYIGLILLAGVIGLGFGFVAVPGVPAPTLERRFDDAVEALRVLLREVSTALHYRTLDRRALGKRFRAAASARQNLQGTVPGGHEPTEDEQVAATQGADGLSGLAVTASALLTRGFTGGPLAGAVNEIARQLGPTAEPDPELITSLLPAVSDGEQRLLLDTMTADLLAVHHAAAALRPAHTPA
ncbi:MAG: hypothetical protein QOF99_2745 [Pseudonocardiales bacterium]|nr:hypothetical protein [Pseudonocardiales bacterium]